jgi:hypothetical protein
MPTNNDPRYPKCFFFKAIPALRFKKLILKIPIILRPNKIINTPPALSSHSRFIPKKLPKYDNVTPKRTNTIEKPKIKNKEFITVSLVISEDFAEDLISSKDLPVI